MKRSLPTPTTQSKPPKAEARTLRLFPTQEALPGMEELATVARRKRHVWGAESAKEEHPDGVRVATCEACGCVRERGRAELGSGLWGWTRYWIGTRQFRGVPTCTRT